MRFLKYALLLPLLLGAPAAEASTAASGYISGITVQYGVVLFVQNGSRSTAPGCNTTSRWAFDANTTAGQATLSMVLTAYALHKPMFIAGTATCTAWADAETVDYIIMAD